MRENSFKQKLLAGRKPIGLWSQLGSEAALEMLAPLDYDWVMIDCEHGQPNTEDLPSLLRALNGSDITSLVRVPSKDDLSVFKRVLDMGVEGVLVPQIYTPEDAAAVVSACRYPPDGVRGIAAARAHQYGLDFADTVTNANDNVMVIVQIETREALECVDDILDVPGLDAILIGPSDLSAALGRTFQFDHPDVVEAFDTILKAAEAKGKPCGIFCNTPEDARTRLNQGFSFANLGTDITLLMKSYTGLLRAMRGEAIT